MTALPTRLTTNVRWSGVVRNESAGTTFMEAAAWRVDSRSADLQLQLLRISGVLSTCELL